jgi:hypothetical protein
MADVVTTFGAKDVGVAATIQRLTQRLAGFQASMTSVSASAKRMQGAFAGLGRSVIGLAAAYVGVSQAINSFNKALGVGGRLDDLSKVTGEAAGNLMLLEKAFDLSGAGADKVGMALAGMARFINDLKSGSAGASETARRLGINLADLAGKMPIEQMRVLLEAIGEVSDANERLGLSMNVFKKVGKDLIPLAVNFGGEMEKAVKQLGSAPAIMDEFAQKLADVGDNMSAIGQKGEQFMMGFIAGAKGIDDMTEAMANFDAAAAGFDFGKIISGSFQAPKQAFLALGEILLLGIVKAGNALLNATVYAGKVYAEMFTDSQLYKNIGSALQAVLTMAATRYGDIMLSVVKTALSAARALPGGFAVDPFGVTSKAITGLQDKLNQSSKAAAEVIGQTMAKGSELMTQAASRVQKANVDFLGAASQKAEADAAVDRLRQLGTSSAAPTTPSTGRNDEASTESAGAKLAEARSKLVEQYNEEVERLRQQELSAEKFKAAMDKLNAQYDAVVRKIEQINAANTSGAGGATMPATVAAPPTNQMTQAALPEQTRQAVASELNSRGITAEKTMDAATETTLQKVASFLEQLNGKLPQPVLA